MHAARNLKNRPKVTHSLGRRASIVASSRERLFKQIRIWWAFRADARRAFSGSAHAPVPGGTACGPLTIPNARGRGSGFAALGTVFGGGSSRTPSARPQAPHPFPSSLFQAEKRKTKEACSPRRQGCPGGVLRGSPRLPRRYDLCSRVIPLPRERPGRRFPRSLARGLVKFAAARVLAKLEQPLGEKPMESRNQRCLHASNQPNHRGNEAGADGWRMPWHVTDDRPALPDKRPIQEALPGGKRPRPMGRGRGARLPDRPLGNLPAMGGASGSTGLNCWVEPAELDPGVGGGELPVSPRPAARSAPPPTPPPPAPAPPSTRSAGPGTAGPAPSARSPPCSASCPCFGVWWISSRSAIRRACSGGNASYSEASLCVFRLSITSTTFSASSCTSSTSQRTTSAKSSAVRRSVTWTARQPSSGSEIMNRLAVPLRTYS